MSTSSLLSLVAFVSITIAFTEQAINDWDDYYVEKWLKGRKMSDDGVKYIMKSGINEGEDLIWIHNQQKTKKKLISGLKKTSDKAIFEQGLNDLIDGIDLENIMEALKGRCIESNTRNKEVCKCINKKSADTKRYDTKRVYDIESDTESEALKENQESETESEALKKQSFREFETESETERRQYKRNKYEIDVDYTVNEIIEGDELRTEISFNILNDGIGGIVYLLWCALANSDDFCSKQSFSFRQRKKNEMKATILTGIAYDFEIYDEMNKYHWSLADFIDSKPNQDGMIIQITAEIPPSHDPNIEDLNKYIKSRRDIFGWSHEMSNGGHRDTLYVSSSSNTADKLMAEKMRSVLLDKYRANNVDISQKMDGFESSNGGWSLSLNSTLLILCAIVLFGGFIVGIYKKFRFKYQNVYSKLLDNKDTKSDV